MEIVWFLVFTAISFVLSEVLRPKNNQSNPLSAHLGDFQFPTATQGRPVPIIWGTVRLNGPNVIWFGNLVAKPITQSQKTSLFSSHTVTTGYKYFLGFQMGLCRGQIDAIKTIWVANKILWQGSVQDGVIAIDQPQFLGGPITGRGGLRGNLFIYSGASGQLADGYLGKTSQNYLWYDNFASGQGGQGLHRYNNSLPGTYYWVGTANGYGPSTSLFSDGAEILVTGQGSGPDVHVYNIQTNITNPNPGDNGGVYSAVLTNASRVRINDNLKVFMTFLPMYAGVDNMTTPTANVFLGMGCCVQDVQPFSDAYGIFVTVHSQSQILVLLNSTSTGGVATLATLTGGIDFPTLGVNTQVIALTKAGNTLTLILNNKQIWTGTDSRIADIPSDHQGIELLFSGNSNINYFNPTVDWTKVGIYDFGLSTVAGPAPGSTVFVSPDNVPALRGTCHAVWRAGYVGTSTQIDPWAFEGQRIPNGLALTGGMHIINQADANPMNVIYEILTDIDWGIGFQSTDIDTTNFTDAATVLYNEGNGFSMVLDSTKQATDVLKIISTQIDGILFINRTTGKWNVKLTRSDYVLLDCPAINETNLINIKSFARGSWAETTNNLRVAFVNRDNEYQPDYGIAQDTANMLIQNNAIVTSEEQYPGVKNKDLASQIAWRDLRVLSYPIAKAQLEVDRTMSATNPGDVIIWSDSSLGIVDMAMRVGRIDFGSLEASSITLDLVQDIFQFQPAAFSAPKSTGGNGATSYNAVTPLVFEAPMALVSRADYLPNYVNRIWTGARANDGSGATIETWTQDESDSGGISPFQLALSGTANVDEGTLLSAMNEEFGYYGEGITITGDPDTTDVLTGDFTNIAPTTLGKGIVNVILVEDEIIGYETITDNGDNTVTLGNVYRGFMDTAPAIHAPGVPVYFLQGGLTDFYYKPAHIIDVKVVPAQNDTVAVQASPRTQITMNDRAIRPYPPSNMVLNGTAWPSSVGISSGMTVEYTRRDWRTADEVLAITDETTLPTDFPAHNTTEYQVKVYDDPYGANNLVHTSAYTSGNSVAIPSGSCGTIGNTVQVKVHTHHTFVGDVYASQHDPAAVSPLVLDSLQDLVWEFNVTSGTGAVGGTLYYVLYQEPTVYGDTPVASTHCIPASLAVGMTFPCWVAARDSVTGQVPSSISGGTTDFWMYIPLGATPTTTPTTYIWDTVIGTFNADPLLFWPAGPQPGGRDALGHELSWSAYNQDYSSSIETSNNPYDNGRVTALGGPVVYRDIWDGVLVGFLIGNRAGNGWDMTDVNHNSYFKRGDLGGPVGTYYLYFIAGGSPPNSLIVS